MREEAHLRVYRDRSVLVHQDGTTEVFVEGRQSQSALARFQQVRASLEAGWFEKVIHDVSQNPAMLHPLSDQDSRLINDLVANITSEYGRAVMGLFIIQLVVKSLVREQSIRLHKGGRAQFSWVEGISMRSIDSRYITPILRKYNLLSVNSYGVFMTRSLAENYPYTRFYKASIRGGKDTWLELVDRLEEGLLEPVNALKYVLACLFNRSQEFARSVEATLDNLNRLLTTPSPLGESEVLNLIKRHINQSNYSARLLEIAIHSFLQVLDERGELIGKLMPLCQMRTANKKHRNIADVEIVSPTNEAVILEAWDAKYGKPYLRDELEELREKLTTHHELERVGFIVNSHPDLREEIMIRRDEIAEETGVEIYLMSLDEWIDFYSNRQSRDKTNIFQEWLKAYVESLCLKRRHYAPIDEPAEQWVRDLSRILSEYTQKGDTL